MTLVNIPFFNMHRMPYDGTVGTHPLDANNDGIGAVLIAPKAGTIDRIGFPVSAVTGTSPTYRLGVQSASGRAPSGTYLGATNAAYVDNAPSGAGYTWLTLGETVTVSQGDILVATALYQSGTVDGSNFATAIRGLSVESFVVSAPYAITLTAGTWSVTARPPSISLKYDDDTVFPFTAAVSGAGNNAINRLSNPLYRGTLWTPAVDQRIVGVQILGSFDDADDFDVHLFEGTGSSPNQTVSVDSSVVHNATGAASAIFVPLEPETLTASTAYRVVIEPKTANFLNNFGHAVFADADSRSAFCGDLMGTTAATAGTWTDYTDRVYSIVPVIDQVDVAASSGGGSFVISG